MYKLLKKPFFGRFMVDWRNPLSEEEKAFWQGHDVKSSSGATLKALYASATTPETKATIVLGHPMGKEAKGFFLKHGYTDLLRNNGFNTLVFDINGFGESGMGNFSFFEDILAAGRLVKEISPAGLPIGYHGVSLGGQWAVISFADENHPFQFAIVESAATTLNEFWTHYPTAHKLLKVFNLLLPGYERKINTEQRMKEAKNLQSLLLIYSDADIYTPISMGERFKKNSPVPTELWTVKSAEHALIMKSEEKEAYKKKILEYFNSCVERDSISKKIEFD